MKEKRTGKSKQIAAIIGIILLVAMYIMTLVFACCRFPGADRLFFASLFATNQKTLDKALKKLIDATQE